MVKTTFKTRLVLCFLLVADVENAQFLPWHRGFCTKILNDFIIAIRELSFRTPGTVCVCVCVCACACVRVCPFVRWITFVSLWCHNKEVFIEYKHGLQSYWEDFSVELFLCVKIIELALECLIQYLPHPPVWILKTCFIFQGFMNFLTLFVCFGGKGEEGHLKESRRSLKQTMDKFTPKAGSEIRTWQNQDAPS